MIRLLWHYSNSVAAASAAMCLEMVIWGALTGEMAKLPALWLLLPALVLAFPFVYALILFGAAPGTVVATAILKRLRIVQPVAWILAGVAAGAIGSAIGLMHRATSLEYDGLLWTRWLDSLKLTALPGGVGGWMFWRQLHGGKY